MARIRTASAALAAALTAAVLLLGAGAAAADTGSMADHGSSATSQEATGAGASTVSNSLAANGVLGGVTSSQVNERNVFAPLLGAFWL